MGGTLLIARVAGERFAVAAGRIQSVIELGEVIPVPRAPAWIAGLTTLRSRSLTVIDTVLALELGAHSLGQHLALVTEIGGCPYALAVDGVENVIEANGPMEPLAIKVAPGWMRCAEGLVETPVGKVLTIDLERLVAGPEQQKAA